MATQRRPAWHQAAASQRDYVA